LRLHMQIQNHNIKLLLPASGLMLKTRMNELDEIWQQLIQKAMADAKAAGRADVAKYLALKASNDAIRIASCEWLFDSFLELSNEVNKRGVKLTIENENPYRFTVGNADMVGSLLRFQYGIRKLEIEAGWTRTPSDGFMREGALARARILHFGISKANAELILARENENLPQWFSIEKDGKRNSFSSNNLRQHFDLFLDVGFGRA